MRGFWHTVEALIAGILLLLFLVVISRPLIANPEPADTSIDAYRLLHDLDRQGLLRDDAIAGNVTGINSRIQIGTDNHSVQVCSASGICNGTVPLAANVWIGSYFISGADAAKNNGLYVPLEIKLYIWE